VFVEKPMTLNIGDADGLIREASARGLVLQVGHVGGSIRPMKLRPHVVDQNTSMRCVWTIHLPLDRYRRVRPDDSTSISR
jgi:hypothetical protein